MQRELPEYKKTLGLGGLISPSAESQTNSSVPPPQEALPQTSKPSWFGRLGDHFKPTLSPTIVPTDQALATPDSEQIVLSPERQAALAASAKDGKFDSTPPPAIIPLRTDGGFSDLRRNSLAVGKPKSPAPPDIIEHRDEGPIAPPDASHDGNVYVDKRFSDRAFQAVLQDRPDILAELTRRGYYNAQGLTKHVRKGLRTIKVPYTREEISDMKAIVQEYMRE